MDGSSGIAHCYGYGQPRAVFLGHQRPADFHQCHNGTPTASFQFGVLAPSTSVAPLQVNGNVAFMATPNVSVGGTAIAMGSYPLIKYTGTVSGTIPTSVTTGREERLGGLHHEHHGQKTIALVVTGSSITTPLYWAAGDSTWDYHLTPIGSSLADRPTILTAMR